MAETGNDHVWPAVIVVVADGSAHGEAGRGNSRFVSDVGEGAVMVVVIERATSGLVLQRHRYRRCIGEVNVGPSVAIIVEDKHAAAHRLDNVLFVGIGDVGELDAGLVSDVDQLRDRPVFADDVFRARRRWRRDGMRLREGVVGHQHREE
jgi:hypothetical protein